MKVSRVFVENAPDQYHVTTGKWGAPSFVACTNEVDAQKVHALLTRVARLEEALKGCRDALYEAGKDFALWNPRALRPNLYELHAQDASAALAQNS